MEREQEEQVQPATTYASDWAGTVDQSAGEVSSGAVTFLTPSSPKSDQHQYFLFTISIHYKKKRL